MKSEIETFYSRVQLNFELKTEPAVAAESGTSGEIPGTSGLLAMTVLNFLIQLSTEIYHKCTMPSTLGSI